MRDTKFLCPLVVVSGIFRNFDISLFISEIILTRGVIQGSVNILLGCIGFLRNIVLKDFQSPDKSFNILYIKRSDFVKYNPVCELTQISPSSI